MQEYFYNLYCRYFREYRYFRGLLANTEFCRYFRGVATFEGSLLWELYGISHPVFIRESPSRAFDGYYNCGYILL